MGKRKRSRYSNLLKRYRDSGGNPSAPDLIGFGEWLNGTRSVNVTNKIPAGGRKLFPIFLFSFTRDFDTAGTTTPILTTASAYSLSGWFGDTPRVTFTNKDGALGHNLAEADKTRAADVSGFYPAMVKTQFSATGAAATTPRSGITNQEYDYTYRRTFSMPFGRNLTTPEQDEYERRIAISAELAGQANPPHTVNFESEILREESFGTAGAEFSTADSVAVN